ncbi:MAG: MXAN_6640 family putative metalloprotease [Nocardioides sp.]
MVLAVAVAPALALTAAPSSARDGRRDVATNPWADSRTPVLARAAAALKGTGPRIDRVEATLALRDLYVARPDLNAAEREDAGQLLARPTNGFSDSYGDGYLAPSSRACSKHMCLHRTRIGADAPPGNAWARTVLQMLERTWQHHVGKLGYRPPPSDGSRGGNGKFDVYLKELGSQGVYGYCAPERTVAGKSRQASSFCVIDDDFSRDQFPGSPLDNLRVTAAHEFFHAIQFGYDFQEDPWLLESTATWMEERFADRVNDNRQYLRFGQVAQPATSLDIFESSGFVHYGNWPFWEYLSERFGVKIVRQIVERAGTGRGLPNDFSIEATRRVLTKHGGFDRVFAEYAAGNAMPSKAYAEGRAFPVSKPAKTAKLSPARAGFTYAAKIDHLSSRTVKLSPGGSLPGRRWRLRLSVNAPSQQTHPAALVVVRPKRGKFVRQLIPLNGTGFGRATIPFGARQVATATVTLVNASTRYRCATDTFFSCHGTPRDQDLRFALSARLTRG